MVAIEPKANYKYLSRHDAVVHHSIIDVTDTNFWNILFLYNFTVIFSVINRQNLSLKMTGYGMMCRGFYL
jgi:hypothetical protein